MEEQEEEPEPELEVEEVKCGLCGGTSDNGGTNPLHKCCDEDCKIGVHATCARATYSWPAQIRDDARVFCVEHAPRPRPMKGAKIMRAPSRYTVA